jgi:hypothetical protein
VKRPQGPQMKMPDLKAPAVVADLYYDLRDRRLLPLIALVAVAIVATPFLLGQDSEVTEPPPVPAAIQALKESGGERTATLTVVEAKPGLRDYRKRLRGREPLDPFRSFGKPSLKGAKLGSGKGSGSASSASTTSTSTTVKETTTKTRTTDETSSGGGSTPTGLPSSGSGGSGKSHVTFYTFAIDVKIVKSVDGKAQEPVVRKRVMSQTPLPGEKDQVVTYMGPARTEDGKATGNVLLLASDRVTEIAGDAKCLSGEEVCQLLEVEPGFPVVFAVGAEGTKYTINVLKLGLVVTGQK